MVTLALTIVTVGNGAVNIALPVFAADLGAGTAELQWVVASYGLALSGFLFTGGALGDRFGRKGVLQMGLLLFLAGSLLGSAADGMAELIASRAAMGVAAALVLPSTLSILVGVFPERERAKAIGIWTCGTGIAGALGPVSTGLILEHYWYGAVFLPNVVLALGCAAATGWAVPTSRDPRRAPIDVPGGVLSVVGIGTIVYGLIQAPRSGWLTGRTGLIFVAGVIVLAAFVVRELWCDEPMLDVRLFRLPTFQGGAIGTVFLYLTMQGTMFLFAQHLQLVAGHGPLVAGSCNVPMGIAIIAASLLSGALARRIGTRAVIVGGTAVVCLSLVLLAAIVRPSAPFLVLTAIVTLYAAAFGLVAAQLTVAIMGSVPDRRAGSGSATNGTSREVGGAIGVALAGSIAATVYAGRVRASATALAGGRADEVESSLGEALDVARSVGSVALAGAARAAFDQSFVVTLVVVVGVGVAVLGVLLRQLPGRVRAGEELSPLDAAAEVVLTTPPRPE